MGMDDRRQDEEMGRKRFTRRALLLGGVQGVVGAVLAARMYKLQVLDAPQYQLMSDQNRFDDSLIAPLRGEILDRKGRPLAVNRENHRLLLTRAGTPDVGETLDRLSRLIDLPDHKRQKAERDLKAASRFAPVMVAENLTWDEFALVNANLPALPGVTPEVGWSRDYPEGTKAAHVTGYVATPSEKDQKKEPENADLLILPGMKIGKHGVEMIEDSRLRGVAGARRAEVNARGRVIREVSRDPGKRGAQLTLTLDAALQAYAMERMGEESGAVVVMDVLTGDILTLASAPGYDPNPFVGGIAYSAWEALDKHPRRPLSNKAVAGAYAPGSTFKAVVALAALHEGAITPRHTVMCGGHVDLGDHTFHCWKRGGHGAVDLHRAIKESCDIFFYDAAKRVGIDKIAEMARKFGMGQKPDVDLPYVRPGVIPDRAWHKQKFGYGWQQGQTYNAGIGQGYVEATPLQLAVMAACLGNGGYRVRPRMIAAIDGEKIPPAPLEDIGLRRAHVEAVQKAMDAVCNEPRGTALGSRIKFPGYEMAGKTGTAQVRRISKGERANRVRKNEELPWELRDHALFVAYAPVKAPRYACAVLVEHGGGGSAVAAPIARDVLQFLMFGGKVPSPTQDAAQAPPAGSAPPPPSQPGGAG